MYGNSPHQKKASLDPVLIDHPLHLLTDTPFYNSLQPPLLGMPFFYWYQMLWIIITSIITAFVYFFGD
ncbi:hypothetical protein KDW_34350 [Dictyobacter vulcani]|uniref:Uncharacterized protein n=1 Tax=Dictyobacter vulcani TaxID=2607529 RepID=A0A5J4KNG7_9CHLR|nr:hypothetical protein KDW_34350 [Dictyobacter vulcani]